MGLSKDPKDRHMNRLVFLATDEQAATLNEMVKNLDYKDRTALIWDALDPKIAAWNKKK
jgi:hypothetical protein